MSTNHLIPDLPKVKSLFGMLFGDGLEIASIDPQPATGGDDSMVAVFVNDAGEPATACFCDLPFAAYSGAALSMIPRGGAEDAAKSGELSEMMRCNLGEVMNICSRLFMSDITPHLKLETLYDKACDLPGDTRSMVETASGRSDFRVSIPGYGTGHIAFLST